MASILNFIILFLLSVKKYFLIDFIFFSLVIFKPEVTFLILEKIRLVVMNIIDVQFVNRFFLASFSYLLFCGTWVARKKVINKGRFKLGPLNGRQIFARVMIVVTTIIFYAKNQAANISSTQVNVVPDKSALFFQLLFCWVIALITIEILEWIFNKPIKF